MRGEGHKDQAVILEMMYKLVERVALDHSRSMLSE